MRLGNLLKSVNKKYQKIPISGISFDSREVKKENIFFAIEGNKISGSKFINEAITKGSSAIVGSNKRMVQKRKIPFILVKDVRKILSEASSNFYKQKPSHIIAVTGTNGKSSVADFFYQILSINHIPVASIGTLGIHSRKYKKKINLTFIQKCICLKNYLIKTLILLRIKKIKNLNSLKKLPKKGK